MSKRVTKAQQYAMLYLLEKGEEDSEIINQLKVSEEQLQRFKEKNQQAGENQIKTKTKKVNAGDLMIRETAGKREKGVAIMTKESSMKSEASKTTQPPSSQKDFIFKPSDG